MLQYQALITKQLQHLAKNSDIRWEHVVGSIARFNLLLPFCYERLCWQVSTSELRFHVSANPLLPLFPLFTFTSLPSAPLHIIKNHIADHKWQICQLIQNEQYVCK